MRFTFEGEQYALEFPRRDVPTTAKHVKIVRMDEGPPKRRETTARLMKVWQTVGDGLIDTHTTEVMRATIRRYHKDPPMTNERARVEALRRLAPYLSEPLRNATLMAYYARPRGKKERKRNEAIVREKLRVKAVWEAAEAANRAGL